MEYLYMYIPSVEEIPLELLEKEEYTPDYRRVKKSTNI
jgi:hypothetical protein